MGRPMSIQNWKYVLKTQFNNCTQLCMNVHYRWFWRATKLLIMGQEAKPTPGLYVWKKSVTFYWFATQLLTLWLIVENSFTNSWFCAVFVENQLIPISIPNWNLLDMERWTFPNKWKNLMRNQSFWALHLAANQLLCKKNCISSYQCQFDTSFVNPIGKILIFKALVSTNIVKKLSYFCLVFVSKE